MVSMSMDWLRTRFAELTAEIATVEVKSAPVRQEYERVTHTMEARCKQLSDQVKEIEAPLFEMKQELAMIARALGGKTGKAE